MEKYILKNDTEPELWFTKGLLGGCCFSSGLSKDALPRCQQCLLERGACLTVG